jgi:predicted tellurium resistance membrane protein TerC
MAWTAQPEAWIALATLTALEIVLGIDNIIFISILVGRLPVPQRRRARIAGLSPAMLMRILLLLSLAWIMRLSRPLFTLPQHAFSGRDLILFGGGLFLLVKSTHEIHTSLEGADQAHQTSDRTALSRVLLQITLLDVVFSLDSVITAVGLARDLAVMIAAIVIAVGVMMVAAGPIGDFVDRHPTFKMLALSFLILVGFTLVAEAFGLHIPKGYIYFALAFSCGVEMLNLKMRKRQAVPVKLHKPGPA